MATRLSWRRALPRTLAGTFLVLQLVVIALVLAVAGLVSVRQAVAQFADSSGSRVLGAAENLAANPLVRAGFSVPDPAGQLAPVAESVRIQSGASLVLLADPGRQVVAGTDPSLVGTELTLPDSRVWSGRSWDGDVTLDGPQLLAAAAPIYAEDGSVIGLALVAEEYPGTWSLLVAGVPELLGLIALAAAAGVAGSLLLARRIKRQTHGLEPAEIAGLADQREAVLYGIREGVLGVDPDGTVTVANDGARELLDLPADVVGRRVDDLELPADLHDVVTGARAGNDLVVVHGDRVLVVNRRAARGARSRTTGGEQESSRWGSVLTLRDRSELIAVQRQLGATRNATDSLRAQTHEFDNQLHVISGLLQLGEYDEAREYVAGLARRRAEADEQIAALVEDPAVAALLGAKSSLAAERLIRLDLLPASRCPRLPHELSTDVATVLGNLVDNAFDAVADVAEAVVQVEITADDHVVRVVVADSGPGLAQGAADRIFDRGFSTKSAAVVGGRGVGLSLVRRVCQDRGGSVGVAAGAPPTPGASFTAVVPRRRPAAGAPAGSPPSAAAPAGPWGEVAHGSE
ncbi:sensor histidine kinase [Nakamurella flava]|nr:ATP-binding protein [Nakamurella flava]